MNTKKKSKTKAPDPNLTLKEKRPKKVSGRPRVQIDLDIVEKLGALDCTIEECAAVLDIPMGTLSTREDFSEAFKKGKERGKLSLRRLMLTHAETNPGAAIFLAKNRLGYRDTPEPPKDRTPIKIVFKPHKLAEGDQ